MLLALIYTIGMTIESLGTFGMVWRLHKYDGRVTSKVISIRVQSYYYRIFTKVNLYYPTYQYNIDGIIYKTEFQRGYRDDFHPVGKEVILCYDKNNLKKIVPLNEEKFWKKEAIKRGIFITLLWLAVLCCYLN